VGYFFVRTTILSLQYVFFSYAPSGQDLRTLGKAMVILLLIAVGAPLFLGLIIQTVDFNPAAARKVPLHNDLFIAIDEWLLGSVPAFWFHSITNPWKGWLDAWSKVLVEIYFSLNEVLGLTLVCLLIFNRRLCIEMFVAFMIAPVLSAPLWYVWPALSPMEAYVIRTVDAPIPSSVQHYLDTFLPNPEIEETIATMRRLAEGADEGFLPVTTMPSMHITWAAIVLYFGMKLWRPLGIILIPYFTLTVFTTLYTMQHYVIDLVVGAVLVVPTLWVGRLAGEYFDRPKDYPTLTLLIQRDLKFFYGTLRGR
jgi:hypothetical protein